jgi:hypothetical protein
MAANDIDTLADFGIFDEAGVAKLAALIRSVQQLASGGVAAKTSRRMRTPATWPNMRQVSPPVSNPGANLAPQLPLEIKG